MSGKATPIKWTEENKEFIRTHTIQDIQARWPEHQKQSLIRKRNQFRKDKGYKPIPKIVPNIKRIGKAPAPYVPPILIYDIETSYMVAKVWSMWQTDVIGGFKGIIQDWQILTVSWCWYDPSKPLSAQRVFCKGQDDFDDYVPGKPNDKTITEYIHGLFNRAEIIIAHNGNSFDQKKCQARMIVHGLTPPSPYQQLDTKVMAKHVAAFTSNKLGDLANMLGSEAQKGDPGGIATWDGCLAGEPKAWKRMKKYNKQDIPPLIDLYEKFRAWNPNHPAINLMKNVVDACPRCGAVSAEVRRAGVRYSKTNTYQRYQCQECGGWFQSRTADKTTPDTRPKYKV